MKKQSRESKTDWIRIEKMQDKDIDLSESAELDTTFFQEAVIWPGNKKQITLRLDPDVVDFFKGQGKGYQTTINRVLRKYVDAQKHKSA